MYHIALWINLITFAKVICVILASTHWIVTDEGFIQPILDSPFHLKVPNDLLAFLEQEDRLSDIHDIYQHFLERKIILEQSLLYSLNEAEFVQKKYKTNENCVRTKNRKFKDIDLTIPFTSDGSDREGIDVKDFFPYESPKPIDKTGAPDCYTLYDLPFSMLTFDHLQGMRERHNLSIPVESALHEWLIPGTSIAAFGHHLSHALMLNTTSWLHYNLATLFWRITGNASNALECSRRAVYLAPREYKDVALLNMGAILYQAQRYIDAAVIFHAAVDHAPFAAINHFILANAYINIAEFDKSAACFKNVITLKSSHEESPTNYNMMLCYAFRVMEIFDMHNAIQEMRNAFKEYQGIFTKWQATGIKALNLQSSLSLKIMDNPNIMLPNAENLQKTSFTSVIADKKIFKYSLLQNHDMFSSDLFGMVQASSNLYKTFDNFQSQIFEISNNYELNDNYLLVKKSQNDLPPVMESPQKVSFKGIKTEANDESSLVVSLLSSYIEKAKLDFRDEAEESDVKECNEKKEEKLKIKYPKDTMKVSRVKFEFDKNSDWPSMEECEEWSIVSSELIDLNGNLKQFPVYLPVDNKGYNVPKILSDYIRVNMKTEHPLPWYPPTCPSKSLLNVDYLPDGLKVKPKLLPQFTDDEEIISDILMSSVLQDLEFGKEYQYQEAEVGHRIFMAMKLKVAPKWVLYTLGSLYWRVRKNVPNTLDCLIGAMEEVPSHMKDVPLTSLASVVFELGYVDNAFKLANEAHDINMFEPATNFLLSLIHRKSNRILGQMYHIKQVVRVDEEFMFGKAYELLRAWSCHTKFSIKSQEDLTSDEKVEGNNVHVLSKEGVILSMLCTTMWDGHSCHPSNVFVYENENGGRVMREDGVIPLMIAEEKSLSKVYASSVDLFTKAAFRINLVFDDTLFKIAVPLMQLSDSTMETKEGKLLFKNDITSSNTYIIDKNGYQKDLGKYSIPSKPDADWWSSDVLEWFVGGKQILFYTSKEACSRIKPPENLISSKQIWNLFLERFPTLNQILTPFETSSSLKPNCVVSDSLTPDSDMLLWYFRKPKKPHTHASTEKIMKLLRKLMGGTTASLDKMGAMIAEAMRDHEESWILKILAGIYYSAKGNSQSAITCMKQALTLTPEHDKDVPLLGLSALSFWVNSVHDAIVYSKFAYEIRPNFPAGPLFIGFMLTFAKRENEAFLMLRKAYAIDMDLTVIEDILKYVVCNMKTDGQFEMLFGKLN